MVEKLSGPGSRNDRLALAGSVGSLPSQVAEVAARTLGLELFELPVGGQELDVGMSWHCRHDRDDAHLWPREQVGRCCRRDCLSPAHPELTKA